ncbi:hypothetical protein [Moraxella lacunata]|uniref:hypothetical protein n=1 Tax=Moraxella lacunata TaxID=477 RepID=UPI003EE0F2A7
MGVVGSNPITPTTSKPLEILIFQGVFACFDKIIYKNKSVYFVHFGRKMRKIKINL